MIQRIIYFIFHKTVTGSLSNHIRILIFYDFISCSRRRYLIDLKNTGLKVFNGLDNEINVRLFDHQKLQDYLMNFFLHFENVSEGKKEIHDNVEDHQHHKPANDESKNINFVTIFRNVRSDNFINLIVIIKCHLLHEVRLKLSVRYLLKSSESLTFVPVTFHPQLFHLA
jgi:hypothetical protein